MTSNIMLTLLYLAGVLVIYYLIPQRMRWGILLVTSVIFYMSASPWLVLLVGISAFVSWGAGKKIEENETIERKRGWLLGCVLPLLGILFLFKYLNFFISSVQAALGAAGISMDPLVVKLVLPMGISYYTFKIISYVVDIYKGKRAAEPHLGYFLTYVLFFPQILSGPIERSEGFLVKLHEGLFFDKELFGEGLQRIVLGLFKKMVIANRLSSYVNAVFGSPESYPGLAALMAAFFYSFQIYCDFSGYSDIAIGMSNLLGIRSRKNFDCPYFARDIKDFWNRWHISLSSWLKDYVYISLGGNRVSPLRRRLNVLTTFLVSGLWHGDNWTFIVWGGIHGVWNMCSRKKEDTVGVVRKTMQTLITFVGVTFAWIFFRAESVSAALRYLRHMIFGISLSYDDILNSILPFTGDNTCAAYFLTLCLLLLLLFLYEWGRMYGKGRKRAGMDSYGTGFSLSALWLAVMLGCVVLFGVFGASGFLYANF